jgi:carbon-monoxide dehydrogenase medium subunit
VFELLDRHGDDAALYAGGTELLLALKARVLRYEHLIDLKLLAEFKGVRMDAGEIVIGALSSHYSLATDALLRRTLPAYAALSDGIANIRVRVAGTIGGNLCFAEPHADPPALLAALGARLTLCGREGERSVPMGDFIEAEFTTLRAPDEVLTEIRVPLPAETARYAYRSFGHLERPAVGIAAGYVPKDGAPQYRLWAGAIGGCPIHLGSVEEALAGVPPENIDDVLPRAAKAAAQGLPAHDDLQGSADYKRHLASVLIQRALAQVTGPATDSEAPRGHV